MLGIEPQAKEKKKKKSSCSIAVASSECLMMADKTVEKCTDLENRSRRQNLRLISIEEGAEAGQATPKKMALATTDW